MALSILVILLLASGTLAHQVKLNLPTEINGTNAILLEAWVNPNLTSDTPDFTWMPDNVPHDDYAWLKASPEMANQEVATVSPWAYRDTYNKINPEAAKVLKGYGITLKDLIQRHGAIPPAPPVGYRSWTLFCRYDNPYHPNCNRAYRDYLTKHFQVNMNSNDEAWVKQQIEQMMTEPKENLVYWLYTLPQFLNYLDCAALYDQPQDGVFYEDLCEVEDVSSK